MRHVFATSIQSGMCSSTVQVISRKKSVYAFFMSQRLWYSEKGKPVADLCIKASGSISPHTSSLEDVVGEKKKHIVCYVA